MNYKLVFPFSYAAVSAVREGSIDGSKGLDTYSSLRTYLVLSAYVAWTLPAGRELRGLEMTSCQHVALTAALGETMQPRLRH